MRSKSIFAQFVAPTRSRRWAAVCLALYMLGLGLSATAQDDRRATIITFDVPGASQVTQAFGINPAGTIVGYYAVLNDQIFVYHGFLRTKDGDFTTFEAPDAGTGAGQGTFAFSINPRGVISGYYVDASDVGHGFLRAKDGTFTTIDAPGRAQACSRAPSPSTSTQRGRSPEPSGHLYGQRDWPQPGRGDRGSLH